MNGQVACKVPAAVAVETGKIYYWRACGRSNSQPFCDGSHKGTQFTPLTYAVKQTAKPPFCDGTHRPVYAGCASGSL
jgi:CDGSH iron-sulfur domain-containing protein 3